MTIQVFILLLPLSVALGVHLCHRSHIWWLDQKNNPDRPKKFIDIDMAARRRAEAVRG